MRIGRRSQAMYFFIALCVCLVALATVLYVPWIILTWRSIAYLLIGIPLFLLLVAGLILNTIFLVREVRRNERHDSFLNAVTHELKTPITSIRLYLETLQRRDLPEPKRKEFYSIMLSDSNRLLATVEQVLKAGELGQRTRNKVRIRVALDEIVRESIGTTLQGYHLDPSAIEYTNEAGDENLITIGNPEDLRIAVLNILDNAVKYSSQTPRIRVRLSVRGDAWVRLSITDQGLGIPAAHLKRIFKRFYRVPARNVFKVKGTGLGLFLVRSIAHQHGGETYAESSGEGHGATIHLELPRVFTPLSEISEVQA